MADTAWRKSSYSDNGDCVEIATADRTVLIRNSYHPERGALELERMTMAAFIAACTSGDFD